MKKILLLATVPLLLLSACGGEEGNGSSTNSSSSSESSSSSLPIYDDSYDFSAGDSFTEINVGKKLETGKEYQISYSFPEYGTTIGSEVIIEQSDVAIATPLNEEHSTWTVKGLKEGQFILIIKDAEGFTHYRKTIEVKDAMSLTEMEDYLVEEVEYFQSWIIGMLNMQVTFIGNQTAIAAGRDENGSEFGNITFNYEYEETLADEYIYRVLNWESTATSMVPANFSIYTTGEMAHLYDKNGTYAVLEPVYAK